jgi:predicted N-acetyltransferase YhbS
VIRVVEESSQDFAAREALLDRTMGPRRTAKSSERIREGRLPAEGLALSAKDGETLVGTVRLWHVEAGDAGPALLLGPLAVAPETQGTGVGARLMQAALDRAAALDHAAVLLVGDPEYYERFGFVAVPDMLFMPGPFERRRFLMRALAPGALSGAVGVLRPTGASIPADAEAVAA